MFQIGSYQKYLNFLPEFLIALGTSFILTPIVGYIARKLMVVGLPPSMRKGKTIADFRHLEKQPTPLLGGMAVTLPLIILILMHLRPSDQIWYLIVALFIIIIMGIVDDVVELSGYTQLLIILLAATLIAASPINLSHINNPLGETINLTLSSYKNNLWGIPIEFVFPGDLIAIFWVVSSTVAVKVSAGTDGLMEGNSFIASIILFILAIRFQTWDAAMISILFSGLVLGFLFYNFYPAKIRSGAVGKTSYGFLLSTLSLIIGAKLVTSILILFLPVLDFTWVLIGRYIKHKPKNPLQILSISDQTHLHYRLLHLGLTEVQVALIEYLITATLGAITLLVTGALRTLVIFLGAIVILTFIIYITTREKKDQKLVKKDESKSPEEKYSY